MIRTSTRLAPSAKGARQAARAALIAGILGLSAMGCCGPCCSAPPLPRPSPGAPPSTIPSARPDAAAPPSSTASKKPRPPGPATKLPAKELIADYERDEAAANARYDNHRLRVDGYIIEVNEGTFDNPMVMIAGSPKADPLRASMVQCRVTDRHVNKTRSLVTGTTVVVEGTCEGKRFNQVRLEDCELISGGI